MKREQFEFALRNLNSAHWQWFEDLAAEFLVSEFPNIRTTACVHGDRGRDGYLMAGEDDDSVVFQYSVAEGWEQKILRTAKTLHTNFPNARWLEYVTNQPIGADADSVRARLRTEFGLVLDVRDISWFLDRRNDNDGRESAALEFFDRVGKPILESTRFYESSAPALDTVEQKTVLVHLGLQGIDDAGNRNLTKFAYQALVRTALLGTDIEHHLARKEIHEYVARVVPDVEPDVLISRVDAALKKMDKVYVRHWRKDDEFQLTHEESERISARLAEAALASSRLDDELSEALACAAESVDDGPPLPPAAELVPLARRVLEELLLHRGEAVIEAIRHEGAFTLPSEDVTAVARRAAAQAGVTDPRAAAVVAEAIRVACGPEREALAEYMRRLADSYTLLAFLRATPDVQKAIRAVYSSGDLWLDTNIVLWLLREQLVEEGDGEGRFTRILGAAREAGLGLHVTADVVEEVLRHMSFALACARTATSDWRNRVPFLLAGWVASGRSRAEFADWLTEFRGSEHPNEDLAEYLEEVYGIERMDLDEYAESVDEEVQSAVKEAWLQVHEDRRGHPADEDAEDRKLELARRDASAYLGILGHRQSERNSFLGYTSWWLTTDHLAYGIHERLEYSVRKSFGRPPVMSPDFLTTYLAIRPAGHEVLPTTSLPVIIEMGHSDVTPLEFIERAEAIRESMAGQNERIIRREVRDQLDRARCRVAIPEIHDQDDGV